MGKAHWIKNNADLIAVMQKKFDVHVWEKCVG